MNFSPNDWERKIGHNPALTFIGGLAVATDSAPANGQALCLHFAALAGNYDITLRHATDPAAGIKEVAIDGVIIDTFDAYDAVGGTIVTRSVANVPIVGGDHELTVTINGKNAASTNYFSYNAWCDLVPR